MKKTLLYAVLFFTLCGVVLDSYLVHVHFKYREDTSFKSSTCAWMSGGNDPCKQVNTSEYSEFMGIPVAIFGIAFFSWIFLLTAFALRNALLQKFLLGISLLSSGFNLLGYAYLTYAELFKIHHICPLCVTSASIMFIVFILTLLQYRTPENQSLSPVR